MTLSTETEAADTLWSRALIIQSLEDDLVEVEDVDEEGFEEESLFEAPESLFSDVLEELSEELSELSFLDDEGSFCLPDELPFLP